MPGKLTQVDFFLNYIHLIVISIIVIIIIITFFGGGETCNSTCVEARGQILRASKLPTRSILIHTSMCGLNRKASEVSGL